MVRGAVGSELDATDRLSGKCDGGGTGGCDVGDLGRVAGGRVAGDGGLVCSTVGGDLGTVDGHSGQHRCGEGARGSDGGDIVGLVGGRQGQGDPGEGYLIGGTVRSVLGAADGLADEIDTVDRHDDGFAQGATVAVIDGDGDGFVNVVICGGDV